MYCRRVGMKFVLQNAEFNKISERLRLLSQLNRLAIQEEQVVSGKGRPVLTKVKFIFACFFRQHPVPCNS